MHYALKTHGGLGILIAILAVWQLSCASILGTRSRETNHELARRVVAESVNKLDVECRKGEAWSCLSLAQLFGAEDQFFDEIPLDRVRGANLAGLACDKGEWRGCLLRAQLLPESEVEERQQLINQACRAGEESACRENMGVQEGDKKIVWRSSLKRQEIQNVIRRTLNQVKFCYEKKLSSDRYLEGTVVARFRINGRGKVDVITAGTGTDIADSAVTECVLRTIRRSSFPLPKGGGSVFVNYPFVFSSS